MDSVSKGVSTLSLSCLSYDVHVSIHPSSNFLLSKFQLWGQLLLGQYQDIPRPTERYILSSGCLGFFTQLDKSKMTLLEGVQEASQPDVQITSFGSSLCPLQVFAKQ